MFRMMLNYLNYQKKKKIKTKNKVKVVSVPEYI